MSITEICSDKKKYLPLLLIGDEQEEMIERYLERGWMFVLEDGGVKAECVVTKEKEGIYELKNIATAPQARRKGYARALIEFLFDRFPDCETIYAGTGDSAATIPFYQTCGFEESHRVKGFFTDHYDHPIFENGKQLVDMVYLKRDAPRRPHATKEF